MCLKGTVNWTRVCWTGQYSVTQLWVTLKLKYSSYASRYRSGERVSYTYRACSARSTRESASVRHARAREPQTTRARRKPNSHIRRVVDLHFYGLVTKWSPLVLKVTDDHYWKLVSQSLAYLLLSFNQQVMFTVYSVITLLKTCGGYSP